MGRDVLQPINLFLGTSDNGEDKDINTYVKDLKSKLESIHREARENLKTSQNRQKRDYDLRSVHNTYGVGDVVYKTNSATAIGKSPKLKSPWKGPYVITEVKSPVLYRIKDRKKEEVIHHDRIKLCQDRNHPLWLSRLRNKILKNHSSLETCNSDLEEYNLDTLFQLPGNTESTEIPQLMTSDSLMSLPDLNHRVLGDSTLDTGYDNSDKPHKRIRRRPDYLKDFTV